MNIHEKGRAPYELCKTPEQKKRGAQEHLHVFHKIPPSVFLVFFHVDFISFSFQPFFHLGMAWHGSTMSFCMWALLAEKNAYGIEGIAPWFFCFAMYRRGSRDEAKTQTKRTKMNTKKVEITLSHEGFLGTLDTANEHGSCQWTYFLHHNGLHSFPLRPGQLWG